jgi:hypothetical protein
MLPTYFPFANVADIPRLRLRAARPLTGVDSANNVAGTKDIGIFCWHSVHRTPSFHIHGAYVEKEKKIKTISISINISFRRDWHEWASQASPSTDFARNSLAFYAPRRP